MNKERFEFPFLLTKRDFYCSSKAANVSPGILSAVQRFGCVLVTEDWFLFLNEVYDLHFLVSILNLNLTKVDRAGFSLFFEKRRKTLNKAETAPSTTLLDFGQAVLPERRQSAL